MKTFHRIIFLSFLTLTFIWITGCKKAEQNSLNVSPHDIFFEKEGGNSTIDINTNASQWSITSDAVWVNISQASGNAASTSIVLTAPDNIDDKPRSAVLTITAGSAPAVKIAVTQKASLYPGYNKSPIVADATGMSSTAMDIAHKIKVGWNIGNTMEAIGGETAWGNPAITNDLIKLVKQSGFNAIRIPCSWDQYSNQTTAEIKATWLNRVKEVVQYCVNNDLYVILNVHWDGGWLETNCTLAKQGVTKAKQKAFWEQIATTLT